MGFTPDSPLLISREGEQSMFCTVDVSRLSRDYLKKPIQWGERPTKEELTYLYLELNLSVLELSQYLGGWKSRRNAKKFLKEAGIEKSAKQAANVRKTFYLEKYGVTSPFGVLSIKEKRDQTNLEKYGVLNPSLSADLCGKRRSTFRKRYGADNPSKVECFKEKKYLTHRKNRSFHTSRPEEEVFVLLKAFFPDVERQHRDIRYPFSCDFYVPSRDLFIECNFHWTHGREAYTATNPEHVFKLNKFTTLSEKSIFYASAIKTWTERDVLKRTTAEKNKLNYKEFFIFEEIKGWLKEQIRGENI